MDDGFESRRFALRTRDFLQPLHDLRHRRSCRHNISTRQFSPRICSNSTNSTTAVQQTNTGHFRRPLLFLTCNLIGDLTSVNLS